MNPTPSTSMKPQHVGDHLALYESAGWEFVTRTRGTGVVGVVAMTEDRRLVLVEQFRTPVNARVLELPAGLIGDDQDESALEAARRELLEETGYTAEIESFSHSFSGPSSAGLTNEQVQLVVARNVRKVGEGGGVGDEDIAVYEVPIDTLDDWLIERGTHGVLIDFKVRLAGALADRSDSP